ncbi:MAG TPA: zinc ribbon domain-containing protein [Thermoplasmata archaeon]|nr:zinc ribbon domain-containing protein [Thermoplasmata archaeon]
MHCPQCGAELPPNARFCLSCGAQIPNMPGAPGGAPAPPPPPPVAAPIAPPEAKELKCPACGAPIQPTFGDMVLSCEYCGASVSLGGAGWKAISKHTMLIAKVTEPNDALKVVHDSVDQGFFHRHAFEESKIVEQKLSYVPFWVVPASATTTYQYQDVAVGVGSTIGSIAAAEVLGSALSGGGRRGGFAVIPVMAGPPVNPTRSETLSGTFEYPVVAVKGMTSYQPKDYQFAMDQRGIFDKKQIPAGAVVLNGDIGEDAAQHSAKSYVAQLQGEQAHKKHHMVSQLNTSVEISDGELLHVPIWYFMLEHKGQKSIVLVDAHAGRVIQTVGG